MVDLNAHEAGNGGQSQGKPTTRGVLLYSEREGPPVTVACEVSICCPGLHPPGKVSIQTKKEYCFPLPAASSPLRTLAGYKRLVGLVPLRAGNGVLEVEGLSSRVTGYAEAILHPS